MTPIVKIDQVTKTYDGGHQALKGVSLDIVQGEILALLGPQWCREDNADFDHLRHRQRLGRADHCWWA